MGMLSFTEIAQSNNPNAGDGSKMVGGEAQVSSRR
jgi:hypothetical protein